MIDIIRGDRLYGLKTKDYLIMKVRTYASDYLLKKWHDTNGPTPVQHVQRSRAVHDFYGLLYEKLSGKAYIDFVRQMSLFRDEAYKELLHAEYGVIISYGEAWVKFLVPKSNPELVEWFKENAPKPNKILVRTHSMMIYEPTTYWRDESLKFYNEVIKPMLEKNGTL